MDALNWTYQTYSFPNTLPDFVLPMPEYAGTIYQGPDGYYATNPNAGDPYTGSESSPSYPPGGSRAVVALYHTHGQCAHGMHGGNDVFSSGIPSDKFSADFRGVPSFLNGSNGGANACSLTYRAAYVAGILDALGAEGGAFGVAGGRMYSQLLKQYT